MMLKYQEKLNFRPAISFLVSLSIAISPIQYLNAAEPPNHDKSLFINFSDKASRALAEDPISRERLEQLQKAIERFETNQPPDSNEKKYDVFHITGQRLEIPSRTAIDLDKLTTDLTPIPFSRLYVEYSKESRELIFVATRGENELGEHGTVVARQVISDIDVAAIAQDHEMISLIDRKGNLSLIDMGFVATELGRNPIPIFKNVWEAPADLNLENAKVKARYISLGEPPPPLSVINDPSVVIPRNAYGEPQFKAGDLLVTYQLESGEDKYLGIFSRDVGHAEIVRGSFLLEVQSAISDPEFNKVKQIESIFKRFDDLTALDEVEFKSDRMNPEVRSALMSITPRQIQTLDRRRTDHQKYMHKTRGQFSYQEWQDTYQKLKQQAEEQTQQAEEEVKKVLQYKYSDEKLPENWMELITPKERTNPLPEKKRLSINVKLIARILQASSLAYLLYPLGHDYISAQSQLQFLSAFYENAYPAVLKDASYRIPLLASMASLIGLWPMATGISMVFGKALKTVNLAVQNSQTKVAGYIRDLHRNWSELNVWQKINSFGMRFYSFFIYPLWVWIPKYVLQQRSLISALQNELSPFTRISPESDLGRILNLKNVETVGFNNPFYLPVLSSKKQKDKALTKQKIQSLLTIQKKRTEALAWLLGSMIASEKTGVDMSTILMMAHHDVDTERLNKLLSDPALRNEWYVAADMIYKQLWKLKTVGLNQDLVDLNPEQIQKAYEISMQVSEKMKNTPTSIRAIKELSLRFKRMAKHSSSFLLNLGVEDSNFLRSIYTNKFVSDQVSKEFVTDHIMVVGTYGLYGERADMTHPEHLTADSKGFMWTSRPHLYDVGINTYAHFFVAGARMALVYQSFKALESQNYQPIEDSVYRPNDRQQSLLSGIGSWLKDIANPLKVDIGGVMVKRLFRSFTTIQANILQNLLFRMGLGGQTFSESGRAWALWFSSGQWEYGYPWDIMQPGNKAEGERIESGIERDKNLRAQLSRALKETNPPRSEALLKETYDALYLEYKKNNPKSLQQLEKVLIINGQQKIVEDHQQTLATKNYYGALAALATAITKEDHNKITELRTIISENLASEYSDAQEVKQEFLKLNAEGLLDFSLSNPPNYTKAHPGISWISTWAVAIATTAMAIELSVDSFSPDKLQWDYIGGWFVKSMGLYAAAYLTLGKKPWEFYLSKIEQIKNYWRAKSKSGEVPLETKEPLVDKEEKPRINLARRVKGLICRRLL